MSPHTAEHSRSYTRFSGTVAVLAALAAAACNSVSISGGCISSLTLFVSPSQATVVIGVTWIPEVTVDDGCSTEPVDAAAVTWTSSDTTVVVVGESSGRFWTRGFGQATVTGDYQDSQGQSASTSVEVTVVESPAQDEAFRGGLPRTEGLLPPAPPAGR
jgi:hypothetical protein